MLSIENGINKGTSLPVMEAFYSLQGEGFNTGKPAYFIRLGGCDIGCHWCDVKDSWEASNHPVIAVNEITTEALKFPVRNIVVTGGEPAMYPLQQLTKSLRNAGFNIFLETSGAYKVSGDFDWICLSPKKLKKTLQENYLLANELKVIIYNASDFIFAEEQAKQVKAGTEMFLQPEWSKLKQVQNMIVDYIKINPQWRISLQTHKYLEIP